MATLHARICARAVSNGRPYRDRTTLFGRTWMQSGLSLLNGEDQMATGLGARKFMGGTAILANIAAPPCLWRMCSAFCHRLTQRTEPRAEFGYQ
jgi:hypothetical protein